MNKPNKRGVEVIAIYWFAILFVVAAGVVYMVSSFYGKPYDARELEVGLLADKAADCISYAGYLRDGVLSQEFQENFLDMCKITFEAEEEQYFLELNFYDFNSYQGSEAIFEASAGNQNLYGFCGLKGENLPVCLERELYVLAEDGKPYTVRIKTAIGKNA